MILCFQGETIIERQLRELDELKRQINPQPLTKEEIEKQIKELNTLRQEAPSLSSQEIQKQIEELDKLRHETHETQI